MGRKPFSRSSPPSSYTRTLDAPPRTFNGENASLVSPSDAWKSGGPFDEGEKERELLMAGQGKKLFLERVAGPEWKNCVQLIRGQTYLRPYGEMTERSIEFLGTSPASFCNGKDEEEEWGTIIHFKYSPPHSSLICSTGRQKQIQIPTNTPEWKKKSGDILSTLGVKMKRPTK